MSDLVKVCLIYLPGHLNSLRNGHIAGLVKLMLPTLVYLKCTLLCTLCVMYCLCSSVMLAQHLKFTHDIRLSVSALQILPVTIEFGDKSA